MARWNLERGLEVAELLQGADPSAWRELRRRVGLRSVELRRWERIAAGLVDGFDPGTTLYEQFAGFFDLEDVVAADVAPRPFAGDAILGRHRVHRSQVVKQADVLMLAHMLPELMAPEVIRANYRYYEPRTTHGSSLSPAIHSAVAARIGELEDAVAYFRMAAAIDLDDRMGNAALGIHMATMGGLWQAAVVGFGGLTAGDDGLRFDPRVPAAWGRLAFPVRWRGTRIRVEVRPGAVTLDLDGPASAAVGSGALRRLSAGRYTAVAGRGGRWSGLEEVRPS
jgi:kojibiose phosphorylase